MLREVPPTQDADYTDEKLERRYNADLANDLGNLLNRTVSMIRRYRAGLVPAPGEPVTTDQDLEAVAANLPGAIAEAMGLNFDPQTALAAIWDLVVRANRYVEETAPWSLARAERSGDAAATARLDTALYHLAEALRIIAQALRPFLPDTAKRIAEQIGVALETPSWPAALTWGQLPPGTQVSEPHPIFPRIGG